MKLWQRHLPACAVVLMMGSCCSALHASTPSSFEQEMQIKELREKRTTTPPRAQESIDCLLWEKTTGMDRHAVGNFLWNSQDPCEQKDSAGGQFNPMKDRDQEINRIIDNNLEEQLRQ